MEKQTRRPKRQFSQEFRKEAVELGKRLGVSAAARELGINESLIRVWRKRLEDPSGLPEGKSYKELEKEVTRLKRENGYLKEINKVLKKSTAIFSADLMGDSK